jgi:protein O-mannosyl-transferase
VTRRSAHAIALGAIVVAVAWAYWPAMTGEFLWDDALHVKGNPALRDASGLARIWLHPGDSPQYYPLLHTSFWIDYQLWRFDTLGYHLVNVALHVANAILLALVLGRVGVRGALVAAALFALHPVHAESVAWISERKNVLSGLFFLAALLAAARVFHIAPAPAPTGAARDGAPLNAPQEARIPLASYALLIALFACALLSKTVTVTLPAVIALGIWWKRGRVTPREWLALAPLVVLGAALGLVAVWVEREDIGAEGPEWAFSAVERVLIASRAALFYLGKLALPVDLAFIYPKWRVDAADWRQYLAPAVVALVPAALWKSRLRFGRGPLFAALFFLIVLSPALGFVNIYPMLYTFAADHFQYLASIGPISAAATLATSRARGRLRWLAISLVVVAAILLGWLTHREAHKYRSAEALWSDTIAKSPGSALAHNNFGQALYAQGRLEEARGEFEAAARLDPRGAEALNNWANVLAQQGRIAEAIEKYREATRVTPDWTPPIVSLAWILATNPDPRMRDGAEALRLAERAYEATRGRDPASLDVMAAALAEVGRFDEASRAATAAAQLATATGKKRLAREIAERAALYGQGRPFRSETEADASE